MKTNLSDVLLLKLIKDFGTLEIWTNQDPHTYQTGNVPIGKEGERDARMLQAFIQRGLLKNISIAANCQLFQLTAEGEALIKTHNLNFKPIT